MTLEDFFTLTEMKDGLTAPARIEELVAVMKKEKDRFLKNVGDASRQWSTVASVIAATDNRDCLDLFIQLDGLWFIDRWLKDTLAFDTDSTDCFAEVSILALLKALENLKINNERLSSSGICVTVSNLLSHKSTGIQDKARALLHGWKHSGVVNEVNLGSEKCEAVYHETNKSGNRLGEGNGNSLCSAADTTHLKVNNQQNEPQLVGDDTASSGCCCVQQLGGFDGALIAPDKTASNDMDSEQKVKDIPESLVKLDTDKGESSNVPEVCPSGRRLESSFPEGQISSDPKQGSDDSKTGAVKLVCSVDYTKQKSQSGSVSDKLSEMETSASVMPKSVDNFSSTVKEDASEPVERAGVATNSNDIDLSTAKSASGDGSILRADSWIDCTGILKNHSTSEEFKASGQGDVVCFNNPLQDSPGNGVKVRKSEDIETKPPQIQNIGFVGKVKERSKDHSKRFSSSCLFVNSRRSSKNVNESSKTSAMDLEYGTVDALEVARLVAQEVERQVEDYDEHFGSSSSEKSLRGVTPFLESPESLHDEKDQHIANDAASSESLTVENMPFEGSQKQEEERHSMKSDNVEGKPENGAQDMESSQVAEAAQERETNAEKGTCPIDLNLEVCPEEADVVSNSVSNSLAVVSALKALAAPRLPSPTLKFEGTLGWKGSAATSAFRTISVGGTSSGLWQRQDFLIDLNVAEDGDDKAANPVLGKQNLMPPGLPSGESSVELSPRRSEKLTFDLNQMSEEDGDFPPSLDCKMGGRPFGPQISHRSPSPASSSSSMKKPGLRNFDLNDRPSNYNDPSSDQHSLFLSQSSVSSSHNKLSTFGGSSDDSVISIMGAKVKKDTAVLHQNPAFFPNERMSESTVIDSNTNLARAGTLLGCAGGSAIPYTPSRLFSYNGLAVGPAVPFTSGMYGPGGGSVAYMVDSRGVSLVPQLIGPPASSTFRGSFAQPAFAPNMVLGQLPGPNAAGPSRPALDLNSGFTIEGSNRDPGAYRQLFIPGQGSLVEEQLRDSLQPALFSGLLGGKRKEPDGGWGEPFVANYERHQPHL